MVLDDVGEEEIGRGVDGLSRGVAHLNTFGERVHGHEKHIGATWGNRDMCGINVEYF